MKSKLALAVAVAAMALAPAAATGQAPGGNVPPHQHYVVTSDGDLVPIGPNSCEDGQSVQFDQFHVHVHRGEPGANGRVVGLMCG